MANPFKKALLSVAAPSKIFNHPLDKRHVTTSDFFQLDVAYFREMPPRETLDFAMRSQARLAAMLLPSFIDVNLQQRAFFVPFRIIFPAWNDFINDSVHVTSANQSGLVTSVPRVNNANIVATLQNPIFSQTTSGDYDDNGNPLFDFSVTSGSSEPWTTNYYNFTSKGRHFYKVLRQLGYKPNFDIRAGQAGNLVYFSALPLLAYAKVFCDWYFPSAYGDDTEKLEVEKIFRRDNSLSPSLTASDIFNIAMYCGYCSYDMDYFTSAFDNPLGPRNGNYSKSVIQDITASSASSSQRNTIVNSGDADNYFSSYRNGTPIISGSTSSSSFVNGSVQQISQFALDALKSMTDYAKRHQLAGSRSFERFLARWGVQLPDTHRSQYLSSNQVPLFIQDVMSTAETESSSDVGANLGDYAGKGIIKQDDIFKVTCDSNGDFGFFMVLTSLIPRVGYVEGTRRHTLHVNKLDFATPEYDSLGNRAILPAELFVPDNGTSELNIDAFTAVFGFTPQYSEYKTALDDLTGDFTLNSINKSGFVSPAWHQMRLFYPQSTTEDQFVHSLSFVRAEDAQQYDRIFAYAPDSKVLGVRADHFVLNHLFNVTARNHLKPLFDTYDFKNEDESNKISVTPNGQTLN